MGVVSLRQAIADRASEMVPAILVSTGVVRHKKGWKDCECSWCLTKREATVVIGSHCPRYANVPYVSEWKEDWRERKRIEYRQRLRTLEQER